MMFTLLAAWQSDARTPAKATSSASATFVDYAQCANGSGTDVNPACTDWINGILQTSNSHYQEDQVTPQRLELSVPKGSAATGRTIQIDYMARKGSANAHAYDSLTTWNVTQSAAVRCQGLVASDCVGGSPTTYTIPPDPTVVVPLGTGNNGSAATSGHQIPGVMTMYGGTITGISVPSHDNPGVLGTDDTASVTITYSVANTTADRKVQLLFGGHLAATGGPRGWGVPKGSSNISGGPYHIKLGAVDGASIGNRDNQIQGASILLPPDLHITKTADAASVSSGSNIGFTVTVSNPGLGDAYSAVLNDPLPSGTGVNWSISPAYTGPGTCSITGSVGSQVLGCAFGTLAAGASASVHVTSPTTANTTGTFTNTATASANNNPAVTAGASESVSQAHLSIAKVADAATVDAGDTIGFVITVSSAGPGSAASVTVSDTLPTDAGTSWTIDAAHSDSGCSITSGALSCSFGSMAGGTSKHVHITSPTTGATPADSPVSNTASYNSANAGTGSASASVAVRAAAIGIQKVADNATVNAGDNVGFTITIANSGAATATGVSVTDTLPSNAGLAWSIDLANSDSGCAISSGALSCSFGSIAPGASKKVHITSPTTTSTTAAGNATISNSASVSTTNDGSGSASASITVLDPSTSITKTPDAATVSAGDGIGFLITVSNAGPGTSTGVTVSDPLPTDGGTTWTIDTEHSDSGCLIASGTLSCSFGSLGVGASKHVHVTSPTSAATAVDSPVDNTASYTTTNDGNGSASASVTVLGAEVHVTKTALADPVSAGDQVGFDIVASNSGPGVAHGVTISDPLPANPGLSWSIDAAHTTASNCSIDAGALTCSSGDLIAGASVTVRITSPTSGATTPDGDMTISNTAGVSASNDGSDSATDTVTVRAADVNIAKTADDDTVSAGDTIGFTITASNTGNGIARGVKIDDDVPADAGLSWSIDSATNADKCSLVDMHLTCNVGELASGAAFTVHITSTTTRDSVGVVSNTASVTTSNDGSDSSTATVTVLGAHVTISKTADAASVSAGDGIGFSISVHNEGPGVAHGVNVSDLLPTDAGTSWSLDSDTSGKCGIDSGSLSCAIGDLASGATVSIHISSPTTSATPADSPVSNTASVTTTNANSGDSTATVTVLGAHVTISKTADAASVSAGDGIGFSISVHNDGPGVAHGVQVEDPLPTDAGTSWSLDSDTSGKCGIDSGSLSCAIGDLASGATVSIHISSPTTSATPADSPVSNTASVRTTNANSDQASDEITVLVASLGVDKTPDAASVSTGDNIGFTITVSSEGPGLAHSVTLDDPLPTNAGIAWTVDGGTGALFCSITDGSVSCAFGDVPAGTSYDVHISSPTTQATAGTVTNTATASASNDGTASDTASVEVLPPDLSLDKKADDAVVSSGDRIGFTLTLRNAGPGVAHAATLDDDLPGGTGIAWSLAEPVTGCAITGDAPTQHLSCSFGDLGVDATREVHVISQTTKDTDGVVANSATADASNSDQVGDSDSVTVNPPHLGLTKTPDASPVNANQPIGFTMVVSNTGLGIARDVQISDPLPSGEGITWSLAPVVDGCAITGADPQTLLCSFGDLGNGESRSVHVSSGTTEQTEGTFSNTATATAGNANDVTATAEVIVHRAHLGVNKVACENTVAPGGVLRYDIDYKNTGTAPATSSTLVDTLPEGTTVHDAGGGTVSEDGRTVTWDLGTLAVDATGAKTLTIDVPTSLDGTDITNSVVLDSPDAPAVNDSATVSVSKGDNAGSTGRAFGLSATVAGTPLVAPTPDSDLGDSSVKTVNLMDGQIVIDALNVVNSKQDASGHSADQAIATTGAVHLALPGLALDAKGLVADSYSFTNPASAASSKGASAVADLVINGTHYGTIDAPKSIVVRNPVTGATLGEVHVLELIRSGGADGVHQPSSGMFQTGLTVRALHIVLNDIAGTPTDESSDITVGSAQTTSAFPSGLACGAQTPLVLGSSLGAGLAHLQPDAGDAVVGYVFLPAGGGDEKSSFADTTPLGLVAGAIRTHGAIGDDQASSDAHGSSVLHDLSLAGGAITATTVSAVSDTTGTTSTGDTILEHLVIAGIDVCAKLGLTPTCHPSKDKMLSLDEGALLVEFNQQGPVGDGLEVTAVHIFVLGSDNALGLPVGAEIILSRVLSGTDAPS